MSSHVDRADDRPVYVVLEGEIDLVSPPHVAWHHVMNFAAWQNYKRLEHVSGRHGGEGELLLLHKDEPGAGKTPYRSRTVLLQPEKRVIWKIFRDVLTEGDATFGIVDFSVAPSPTGSVFRYELLYEFGTSAPSEEEWERLRETYTTRVREMVGGLMPKLQQLVAAAV